MLKTAGFPGSSLAAFSTQNSALLSHSSLLTSNSATFSTRSLWAGFKSTDRYIHTKVQTYRHQFLQKPADIRFIQKARRLQKTIKSVRGGKGKTI